MDVSFFSRTSAAICSISRALFTMNGISVTMIREGPSSSSSISARARITTRPRPVRYASSMPSVPQMSPPVGKSGPRMISSSCSCGSTGSSISASSPATTSRRLCGGMFVAIPTAIPDDPLISRFGAFDGNTEGSFKRPSKFSSKRTVSLSMSASSSMDSRWRRASVYR